MLKTASTTLRKPDISNNRQTDRQTDRQTHCTTSQCYKFIAQQMSEKLQFTKPPRLTSFRLQLLALLQHGIQFLLPLKIVPPYTLSSATSSLTSQPSLLTINIPRPATWRLLAPPNSCLMLDYVRVINFLLLLLIYHYTKIIQCHMRAFFNYQKTK